MIHKNSLIIFACLFMVFDGFAQTPALDDKPGQNWIPISLAMTGQNMQDGVEAFYQLVKCNEENVVLVKLINHNDNLVRIEWNNAVFTKEKKWVTEFNTVEKRFLTIKANETIQGQYLNKSEAQLVIHVNDFVKNIDDFKRYGMTSFHVTFIKR